MSRDPIVDQVRAVSQRQAAQWNYDIRAIVEDAMKRQRDSGEEVVSLPPKRAASTKQASP
jgi:hypothetical protein